MKIKFRIFFYLLVITSLSRVSAQNSFTNCIMVPGDVFTVSTVNSGYANLAVIGPAGTGQFWDFTKVLGSYQYVDTVFTANQTATALFPSATLMRRSGYGMGCYKTTTNGLEYVGSNQGLGYSNPELIVPTTITYGSTYNDTWTFTVSLGPNQTSTSTANVSMLADATGVLITAGGNFSNVIRIKSANNITVSNPNQADKMYTHLDYYWFQEGIHQPVFSLKTWTISTSIQRTAEYLDFGLNANSISKVSNLNKLLVYPNPCTDHIQIAGLSESYHVEIYDVTGRTAISLSCLNDEEISLAQLSSGLYFMKLSGTNDQYQTIKIQKQ